MSTIQASNISDGTDTVGTEYVINGSAKAWAHVNASGGTPSLDKSYNVSSITDNGVGSYAVNLTNSFDSANYSAVVGGITNNNLNGSCFNSNSAGSYSMNYRNPSGTYFDTDNANSVALGDLA